MGREISSTTIPVPIQLPYLNGPGDFVDDNLARHIDSNMEVAYALGDPAERNNYVAEKMFIIDRNYSKYEAELSQQHDFSTFFGSIATIGMTSAGAVIPLGPTSKILNTTILAVSSAKAAFDKDVLLAQTVQAVQSQMRGDRATQAKVLLARMSCDITQYPFFLAMSDLEDYRRAGTFEVALANMTKAVANSETAAEASKKSSSKPSTGKVQQALQILSDELSKPKSPCPVALGSTQ